MPFSSKKKPQPKIQPIKEAAPESALISLFKNLQENKDSAGIESMPEPTFDPYMGADFKRRKVKRGFGLDV